MKLTEVGIIPIPANYSELNQVQRAQVRAQYIRLQKGLCYFCNEPLTDVPSDLVRKARLNMNLFPAGFLRYPIHLHHCHKSDLTLGAVHSECNAYMWQYLGE